MSKDRKSTAVSSREEILIPVNTKLWRTDMAPGCEIKRYTFVKCTRYVNGRLAKVRPYVSHGTDINFTDGDRFHTIPVTDEIMDDRAVLNRYVREQLQRSGIFVNGRVGKAMGVLQKHLKIW